jgi:oligopeptide/dipeptide ABC transporter ATP-binding protein
VQSQILNLLEDMRREFDLTYLLISHNLAVVEHIATRVAVMYLGRIVEEAATADLFRAPRHPYTRALLRSIPTVLAKPRTRLPTIAGSIPHPFDRPKGCPYHPRCAEIITGACETNEPPVTGEVGAQVRCFLHGGRA